MSAIGDLVVTLGMNIRPLQSKLNRAKYGLSSFESSTTAAMGRLRNIFATFGIGLSAAAVVHMVKNQMELIDSTGKLTDRLGTTTENLVRLRYAADLAGTSSEALQKGLEKMLRTIGDAISLKGSAEAKDAFAQLGLSPEQLGRLDAVKAFEKIAGAISRLQTQAEKADVAAAIFGRGGVGLLNTINLGAEGLKKMGDEAERLGLTFSRLDASRVEAANDAIRRMNLAFGVIAQQLAIGIAPYLEMIADTLTNKVAGGVDNVTKKVAVLANVLHRIKLGFKLVGAIIDEAGVKVGHLNKQTGKMDFGSSQLDQWWKDFMAETPSKLASLSMKRSQVDLAKGGGRAVASPLPNYLQIDAAAKSQEALVKQGVALAQTPLDEYNNKLDALDAALQANAITIGRWRMAEEKAAIAAGMIPDRATAFEELVKQGQALAQTPLDVYNSKVDSLDAALQAHKITVDAWRMAEEKAAAAAGLIPDRLAKQNEMMTEGRILMESLLTPQEQLTKKIEDYQRLLQAGAINPEFYRRGVKAAALDFQRNNAAAQTELPTSKLRGSDEAWRGIVANMYGLNNNKSQEKVAENTKRLVELAEEAARNQNTVTLEQISISG